MNIEIRNISYNARLSQETNAFHASLYIDGKKVGYAENSGHGGPTDYRADKPEFNEIIERAEEYCKNLPPHESSFGGDPLPMDLEFFIDLLVDKEINDRAMKAALKRVEKKFINHLIFFKVGSNTEYREYSFGKPKRNLRDINANHLQLQIQTLKRQMEREGYELRNTNINPDGTLKP